MSPTCIGSCCINPSWEHPPKLNVNVLETFKVAYYSNSPALTDEEKQVLSNLCDSWKSFSELPNRTQDDADEFKDAIHRCQQLIALRVARRVNPDVWTQP